MVGFLNGIIVFPKNNKNFESAPQAYLPPRGPLEYTPPYLGTRVPPTPPTSTATTSPCSGKLSIQSRKQIPDANLLELTAIRLILFRSLFTLSKCINIIKTHRLTNWRQIDKSIYNWINQNGLPIEKIIFTSLNLSHANLMKRNIHLVFRKRNDRFDKVYSESLLSQ